MRSLAPPTSWTLNAHAQQLDSAIPDSGEIKKSLCCHLENKLNSLLWICLFEQIINSQKSCLDALQARDIIVQ